MSDEDEACDQAEEDENEDEELEASADDDDSGDPVEAIEAADDDEDAPAATPVGRATRGEAPEAHSVAARAALRNTLAADVEAFLKRGGSIQEIADDQRAEPAKKSDSSYGRGSA